MNGIIVGIDKEGNQRLFRVMLFTYKNGEWGNFTRQRVAENQLALTMINKKVILTNGIVGPANSVKGKTGDLSRFENKVNKPLVILSEIVTAEQGTIGYKIANYEGTVKNITSKELLGYCGRISKTGGIPVQNGMYVPDKDGQKAHIRCYPGGDFIKEVIERKKSENAKPAAIDTEKNAKSISKLEELFTPEQIKELKLGKQHGVNIKIYGDNKLSAPQMKVIREALEEGLNAKLFADPAYSVESMRLLRADMKYGVDVSYYLNPKYSAEQLSELSEGFISGVDVSKYADPKNKPEEMAETRMRLENNIWKEHSVKNDESWK